jgi:hypothetical protein
VEDVAAELGLSMPQAARVVRHMQADSVLLIQQVGLEARPARQVGFEPGTGSGLRPPRATRTRLPRDNHAASVGPEEFKLCHQDGRWLSWIAVTALSFALAVVLAAGMIGGLENDSLLERWSCDSLNVVVVGLAGIAITGHSPTIAARILGAWRHRNGPW